MKFLVDNQLPGALSGFLCEQGHDASHVLEIGMDEAQDFEVWDRAKLEGRWLVSKDEDFFHLANRAGEDGRLIWVRLGNCRNEPLIRRFESELERIQSAEDAGEHLIEIR